MANGDVLQNAPVSGMKKRFPRSFGHYILERSLSRGGMGEVLLAVPKGVNKRCVIKTIRGDLTGDEEFVGRFSDEAKIMVRMGHENIIRVFDCGKIESDYYIAMEYVHGRDLGDVLDRAYERGQPMPLPLGLYVAEQLLSGIGYAHELTDEHGRRMGLVHRDISPQNVLIGFDGSVKLIDFGLARSDLLPGRTQGALAVGKYGYMSPEQARHERIDGRADLYSTGVMLFEVFTGDRLVDEQDQATLWQRVLSPKHRNPRSVLPELPRELDDLVMRAVAVRPSDRFSNADEMRQAAGRVPAHRAGREDLVHYLRVLYPKADFSPPPIPDFEGAFDHPGEERSMIFALSREGALSVFGRGQLAVDFTAQLKPTEPPSARPRRSEPEPEHRVPKVLTVDIPESPAEATVVRGADRGREGQGKHGPVDLPTQIGVVPDGINQTDETRYARPPSDTDGDGARAPEPALRAQPVKNLGAAQTYRDDEQTVMMDAPPRGIGGLVKDALDDEGPTRAAVPVEDDGRAPMTSSAQGGPASGGAALRGRAIREKNARSDERDERGRRDPAEERPKKNLQVHRTTVGTRDLEPSPPPRREAPRAAAAGPGDETLAELKRPEKVSWLVPAALLVGVVLLVAAAVVFLLGG